MSSSSQTQPSERRSALAGAEAMLPDHCAKDVVVLCCGNTLFGDDGFGPAVAERLDARSVPPWAAVIDAGTAVRELLFDMVLCERRPQRVVVVDAVEMDRRPGEVFEISLAEIPRVQASEFSLHQAPTSNLLKELDDVGGVRVTVIACQVETIPDEMSEGLSSPVAAAVDEAAEWIARRFLARPPAEAPDSA